MSFSASLTAGSGIGTEAVWRGNSSVKLLKIGRAILKYGKAYTAAAPMTTKADKDTTIVGTRLDRPFNATGCLSSCVSLFSVSSRGSFSGVSATCVRLGSMKQGQGRPATAPFARLPIQNRLGSWAYRVNARLPPPPSCMGAKMLPSPICALIDGPDARRKMPDRRRLRVRSARASRRCNDVARRRRLAPFVSI